MPGRFRLWRPVSPERRRFESRHTERISDNRCCKRHMHSRFEMQLYPPRAAIIAERLTLVAAVRGISSTNSTVLGTL
jgi:hypothetical protein